jgi:hypothetical protein
LLLFGLGIYMLFGETRKDPGWPARFKSFAIFCAWGNGILMGLFARAKIGEK